GAAAISVITEETYFKGDKNFLTAVKDKVNLPILRKDFIIDEIQLYETLVIGADMVLLIASILPYPQLLKLIETCHSLSLEPLVEVHSQSEVKMLADLPIRIAGINNRNLKDFTVDINHSLRLVNYIPDHIFKVSESGISKPADLMSLEKHGFNAALIGEILVTNPSPGQKLRELLNYQENLYDKS
ncbi:MAG: indole-3-glycerol-phosphate synthase, partial [Syntrophomonadaceae bacterium]|nr:indole-3-glycerol-phosphate synthase [Syntrophomonadaceae bacterium]